MSERVPPEVDRVAASRAAVAARRGRAAVKHALSAGERAPLEVAEAAWADPTGPEGTLRVPQFLASLPGLGPARSARVLERLGISDVKRLGGLGVRQRRRLVDWLVERAQHGGYPRGRLVVLAGPTAVGKGSVSSHIREHHPEIHLSVSATTRGPRPGETEGVDYYFVSDEEFDRLERSGRMLETATVHNAYRYGTPSEPVERALAAGRNVLLEIDLQGARSVRAAVPDAVLIFLLPPDWEELVRRLVGRGTESQEEQGRRLQTAKVELAAQDEFDYRVVNDDVGRAAQEVVDLMETFPSTKEHHHG